MFSNSQRLNNRVIKCPYDNHLIAKSRIQNHLIKCEKRFPKNYKLMCPYDGTHRIFDHEMKEHILTCPARNTLAPEGFSSAMSGRGSINRDLYTDYSSITDTDDECWDLDRSSVSRKEIAETNDEAKNILKNASEVELEETDDLNPLRFPRGYPETAMVEEPEGSVIEDDQSITSSMGIGRGKSLQDATGLTKFGFGRGKQLTE